MRWTDIQKRYLKNKIWRRYMRAEDTLQYMADFYPELFPTRKHALNQLFCVLGNGYEWINGELVDDDNEYKKRYKLRKQIKRAEFPNEESWYQQNKFYRDLYKGEEDKIPWKYNFEWYPLGKDLEKLYNYPNDIKTDWKALLEECKALLIADGIEV